MDSSTQASTQVSTHANSSDENAKIKALLEFCREAKTRSEIQEFLGFKSRKHTREKFINPLVKGGFLRLTEPDSPRSPTQKYIYKIYKNLPDPPNTNEVFT
jgi:ATP-dependent DNA helicase RecG